jgi:8-oxo-dGTP pyrophosphatase MutT (NUDIX family)
MAPDAGFEARLRACLEPLSGGRGAARSDYDLAPSLRQAHSAQTLRPAAVLAPIVRRPEGWTMLFTVRAADLPWHAGQVSFPGGRLQPEDADAVAAALRETREEIGLASEAIEPIGALDPYETVTGFLVRPIVGLVAPAFELALDPREVDQVFEVPLNVLLDPARLERREREWRGQARAFYVIEHEGRTIWGATAGMLKSLHDRLYG